MATITGCCMCGAVRYECNAEPAFMANCHCRDCQRATGAAYFPTLVVPRNAVKITGEPKYYESAGGSGKLIKRGFCANCGSRLFALPELIPDLLGIPAASLDDPSIFKPSMDFFTASAQPWHQMNPELPKFPQTPPMN